MLKKHHEELLGWDSSPKTESDARAQALSQYVILNLVTAVICDNSMKIVSVPPTSFRLHGGRRPPWLGFRFAGQDWII